MANNFVSPQIVAKEGLMMLENNLGIAKRINTSYVKEWGKKPGDSISIRKPVKFQAVKSRTFNKSQISEDTATLAVVNQAHVGFGIPTADLTKSVEFISERYIAPAVSELANLVELDIFSLYYKLYNAVGTPGSTPATYAALGAVAQRMDEEAIPQENRNITLNPAARWAMADGLKTLYMPSKIDKLAEKGLVGPLAGLGDIWASQLVVNHTVGALGGTPLVNGAAQVGNSLVTDGWTAAIATRLKKGDVFTIANVNAINPKTRLSTGSLRQFVCTADAASDGSGNLTAAIYPPIITSGAYQTVDAAPADNAALTIKGTAATAYPQNLAFHRDCFALVTLPLEMPNGVSFKAQETSSNGLSIRVLSWYDGQIDEELYRLDILYGTDCVYPELGVRLFG